MSQGALAHSWNQPNPPGRHSTATPIHNANTPNINETHPSPLLPGLYLRCRSGRHRPGNMAGKEEEGIISCTSWRETSVAHMLYTRLPSAVPPPPAPITSSVVPISFLPTTQSSGIGDGEPSRDSNPTLSPPRVSHQPGTDFCTKLSIRYQAHVSFNLSLCWYLHRAGKAVIRALESWPFFSSMCEPPGSRV